MAEIKNNFTSSKMNQDIDDRLMPNNEYRYALNLEVNRSEASDVGTLQNILGNSLTVNFNALANTTGLECIGVYADESNNNIYIFLTNYSGTDYSPTAKNYIYVYNNKQNATNLLVSGAFLNFSTQFPIYGINLLESLLFWTDNRNQPRRINVSKAFANSTYYINEEQISVAKLSPLYSPELYRESVLEPGQYETTMYDVVSEYLPNGTTPNPYYDAGWAGDPAYLESKYVRFSYRYKFKDGEYSIMAPFTQIAYIPKQDGYFLYSPPPSVGAEPAVDDETAAYRSTIVGFMQNKVNNILLQILLPGPANLISSLYEISEIEILYKEADSVAVSAVDSIPTLPDPSKGSGYVWNTSAVVYSYDYQSKKPFKTLPSRDVIRVYDTTPVKALSQEVVGNRIVYGNYQDKFSYPKYLNYNVGASTKLPFGFTSDKGTSKVEYPNHSVKENRNYQVGVVLADRFGRQSGVILSDQISTDFPGQFGASSLYLPYNGSGDIIPSEWSGNSLKILFNSPISPTLPNTSTGWPGIYNGDINSVNYNPLGWYSYKIVVKQTEQDYYNVYLPGTMAAYPDSPTLELGKTSHIVLLNDNINKVPRDLSEVGPAQRQFRSSVILFPRVNNNTSAYNNEQFYPGNEYAFVSTIATSNSLFYPDGISPSTVPAGFENFYQINSDPIIARISTPVELGVITSTNDVINLSVYETKPVESKLDIYWETSTAGLITELNTAIEEGSTESLGNLNGWNFTLSEAAAPGTITSTGFSFDNILGDDVIPDTVTITNVITGTGTNVTSKFVIEQTSTPGVYRIKTAPGAYFYYGFSASTAEAYTFTINATVGYPIISKNYTRTGALSNVSPTITNKPTSTISLAEGVVNVYDFDGVNGSNPSGGNSTSNLAWSVAGSSLFSITSSGLLQQLDGTAEGTFNLVVTMTEASGATDTANVTVTYPYRVSVVFDGPTQYQFNVPPGGTGNYLGTVTVTGLPATFRAASVRSFGDSQIDTTISVDGNFKDANIPIGSGFTSVTSTGFTLPPGTYGYSLYVKVHPSTGGISGQGLGKIESSQ
jgi:hypothetical protein